jgi:hypothetical protein
VTGIVRRCGLRGVFFFQSGQLGFQVGYTLAKTAQFGGQTLVRRADVAQESLRHDGSPPPCSTAGVTHSMPSRAVENQVHCLWR